MLAIIQNSPRFAFGREIHIPSSLVETNVLLMNSLVLLIDTICLVLINIS